MEIDALFFQQNQAMLMGVAAMLCGTALLHLVLMRMIRKRGHQKEAGDWSDETGSGGAHSPVFFPEPVLE